MEPKQPSAKCPTSKPSPGPSNVAQRAEPLYISNRSTKRSTTLLEKAGKVADKGSVDESLEFASALNKDELSPISPLTHLPEEAPKMFDVNKVIEVCGFGRYQCKVLFIMGIMSLADSAEIWLATIVLYNLKCEWELTNYEKAMIPAVIYLFYTIGSTISGTLADRFGRLPVLMVNSYLLLISALCSAFSTSYYFFLCCRAVVGFCIGGSYGTCIVYTAEMVPIKVRSWNMFILEIFWCLGSIYECLAAFFVMELRNGWRIQILLTAIPVLIMLILMHFMEESPRYLTIKGKKEEALSVVAKICTANAKEVPSGDLFCSDVRSGAYREVWATPYTKQSIMISIHYICNMFLVFGITMLIADMMYYNYCSINMFFDLTYTDSNGCTVYTKAEYLVLMVIAVAFIPGMLLGTVGAETIGRRWTFVISIASGAISTILLLFCANSVLTLIKLFLCVLSYAAYNEVLWIFAPESYPTYMRGTAVGAQNGIGKLGAAVGIFSIEYLKLDCIK